MYCIYISITKGLYWKIALHLGCCVLMKDDFMKWLPISLANIGLLAATYLSLAKMGSCWWKGVFKNISLFQNIKIWAELPSHIIDILINEHCYTGVG